MITIDPGGLRSLRQAMSELEANMPKEMKTATSKTIRRGKSITAKKLSRIIKAKQKILRAVGRGKREGQQAFFILSGNFRISWKWFKPVQTKSGVTVKATRVPLSPQTVAQLNKAFMGPRPGVVAVKLRGQVMRRKAVSGRAINAVPAMVPVEMLRQNPAMVDEIVADLTAEYEKQLRERIRFLKVKMAGKLRNQKQ